MEEETNIYQDLRGMRCKIEPGILDKNAQHLFMNGQCHALAIEIAKRQNWKVGLISAYSAHDDSFIDAPHMVAICPDGRLGDAKGLYSEDFIYDAYNIDENTYIEIVELEPEEVVEYLESLGENGNWQMPDEKLAKPFVEPVLKEWGFELRPQLEADNLPDFDVADDYWTGPRL